LLEIINEQRVLYALRLRTYAKMFILRTLHDCFWENQIVLLNLPCYFKTLLL